jgi:hypothetical protein
MTMRRSMLRSRLVLRSTLALLLSTGAAACVPEDPPPAGGSSGTTVSSSDATAPATITTGGPAATSTSTTPGASTSGGSSDESDGDFLPRPDGGGCPRVATPNGFRSLCIECDVVAQDCPNGDKCVPYANDGGELWSSFRCSPVPENPAGPGEPCMAEGSPASGLDDCELGALCFGVDPRTLQGTCSPLCDPILQTPCSADEVCAAYNAFTPYVCLPRCDPFDSATCAPDETCRGIGDDVLCVPTVVLPQGLWCGAPEQYCAVDEACMWADLLASCADSQCCRPWCDLSAPAPDLPCAAEPGEVCRPYSDAPPAGYEHVGACGLPV